MFSDTPVLTFATDCVNWEVPPLVRPGVTACAERVGTSTPTLMLAAMLSVATTDGAEITRALPLFSAKLTAERSSRLLPIKVPAANAWPAAPKLPVNCRALGASLAAFC